MLLRRGIFIILLALLLSVFVALRTGLLGGRYASEATTTPAQATQVHEAGYWKSFVKPDDATLRSKLTPLEYDVTQNSGTETPFNNAYWNNEEQGIYVDIVSGEPLFSSTDKYDSSTGWPSFTKPLDPSAVVVRDDYTLGIKRTEVRSNLANSHLGHLFDDGPQPTGLRYCMNSASLRFVPKDKMVAEGYGEYLSLFQ